MLGEIDVNARKASSLEKHGLKHMSSCEARLVKVSSSVKLPDRIY